jgi:hypothetical protein
LAPKIHGVQNRPATEVKTAPRAAVAQLATKDPPHEHHINIFGQSKPVEEGGVVRSHGSRSSKNLTGGGIES